MKRKWVFIGVCTAVHPFVFIAGAIAIAATGQGMLSGLPRACAELFLRVMLPLYPLAPMLSRHGPPSLSIIIGFFLANGFLWGLCLWHARAAWRQLRNLPPVGQLS